MSRRFPWYWSRSLLDQEILDLLALLGQRGHPARLLAAAGPGFLGIGRVAVFRRDLAQLAALFRRLARRCRRLRGAAAEQLGDGVTLGLGQLAQLAAHGGDGLALLERGLEGLGLGDQRLQFFGRKAVQIDCHQNLRLILRGEALVWPFRDDNRKRGIIQNAGFAFPIPLKGRASRRGGYCRRASSVPRSRFSDSSAARARYSNVPASRPRPDTPRGVGCRTVRCRRTSGRGAGRGRRARFRCRRRTVRGTALRRRRPRYRRAWD